MDRVIKGGIIGILLIIVVAMIDSMIKRNHEQPEEPVKPKSYIIVNKFMDIEPMVVVRADDKSYTVIPVTRNLYKHHHVGDTISR